MSGNLCRICLNESTDLKFSFEDCVEMVKNLAHIEPILLDGEGIPTHVCNPCYQKLFIATDIQKICRESEKYFSEWLSMQETVQVECKVETVEEVIVMELVPRCCICSETFADIESFQKHCLELHEIKVGTESDEYCGVCRKDLEPEHRTCEVCWESFSAEDEFLEHAETHKQTVEEMVVEYLEEGEDPIDESNTVPEVSIKEELADGVGLNANKKRSNHRYGCCQCPYASKAKSEVMDHFNVNHAEAFCTKPKVGYTCYLCNQSFETRAEVLLHEKEPRLQAFPCTHCGECFPSAFRLTRHCDKHHQSQQDFACDECDRTYSKLASLKHHKYIMHNDARIFHCDICDKDFRRRGFFKEHMDAHAGNKTHKCQFEGCDASFARKNNLVQHMRKHTKERPYACKYCEKTYAHCTDLKRHVYSHTDSWPFVCSACGKGFAKKSAIISHLKLHGDLTEYIERQNDCKLEFKMVSENL